jgi:hypothetical protein
MAGAVSTVKFDGRLVVHGQVDEMQRRLDGTLAETTPRGSQVFPAGCVLREFGSLRPQQPLRLPSTQ